MIYNYIRIKNLLVAISIVSCQLTIVAQEQDSTVNRDLEQVVVTATRTPKTLKSVPVVTRLITEADIKKVDATNVQDLLTQELPGLEFTYSMNQQTSINLSGFGGNSVLFLVDGERLAGETLDNVDYTRLNLDNVGRIEIVKGAASTLYGSNAVGGVVNIMTRTSSEPWTLNLNTRYGKHNEWRHGLSTSFCVGKFNNSLNAQHTAIDRVHLSDNSESSISNIYAYHTWNVKDKLVFAPTDVLKFTGRVGYFFRERESSETSHDRYRDYSAGLKGDWNISDNTDLTIAYSFDQYDKSDYATLSNMDIRDYSNVQHIARTVLNQKMGKNTLTVGADYMRDYLMSYQFEDNGSKNQHTIDAFGQFDWQASDHCSLLMGVRYDHFSEADANSVTGKLAAMYNTKYCSLRLNYAGGFRAPTLKEMYMKFDMASIFMIYGNEDLKPERSHNFSFAIEHAKNLSNWRYNIVATAYYNLVSNRISTAWNQSLNGMRYINMADLQVIGADVCCYIKTDCGLGLKGAYAYTHEHIKKGEPETSSTRPHTVTARFDYDHQWKNYGFNVALSGRFLSSVTVDEYTSVTDYTSTSSVDYDGYTIWKLTLLQRIWKGINLTFAVDNIFNYTPKVYYSNSPSTTGATCSVGLSVDVEKLFN
ncbi:MAG: TonB-dependent receptor [Bacteroidales bacterium]|nr:TonB-dependent receptor [Bacteroidales bacterium]